jgi:DNA-binding NarL/FixJ family response regulator
VTIEERRAKVAEMVQAGKSERAIAGELKVSRSTVWADKQAAKRRP